MNPKLMLTALLCHGILWSAQAQAQEVQIRKNLAARAPDFAQIDGVTKTPMAGVYEVRIHGSDLYYTDASGSYLIKGEMLDTRSQRNLTRARQDQLTKIKFDALPLKDAFTIVHGKGERKVAIFEDPNCGFCKRFEKEFQAVDNVTAYVFMYPVLGADSVAKAKNLWCSADRPASWENWILRERPAKGLYPCDSTALDRNVEFGQRYRLEGTPTLIFSDNTRHAGAVDAREMEKLLAAAQTK